MKNYIFIALLCIATLFSIACSKKQIEIGRNNPDKELQKCMKLSEKKQFEEAVECLEIFKSRFPRTEYSRMAEIAIADNYFQNKEYLLAADAYNLFIRLHPTSPKSDYAYYRLGLSYLKETPKAIDRDQQYLDEAVQYLRLTLMSFPNSPYKEAATEALKDARNRVAARIYYIGNFYYRTGEYRAAIPRFLDIVNDYSETDVVPITLYKLVLSTSKINRIDDAKLFFSKLNIEYPTSEWTKKSEKKLNKYIKKAENKKDDF